MYLNERFKKTKRTKVKHNKEVFEQQLMSVAYNRLKHRARRKLNLTECITGRSVFIVIEHY